MAKTSVSINVALLKKAYWDKRDYLDSNQIDKIEDARLLSGMVHWVDVAAERPEWVNVFFNGKELKHLRKQHAKALYVVEQSVAGSDKTDYKFAIAFGHGKYLLNDSALVPNFGRKVVMNLMDENNVTRVHSKGLAKDQNLKTEQNYMFGDFATFSFDQDSDFLTGIKIKPEFENSEDLTGSMTGKTMLQCRTRRTYEDIEHTLALLVHYFEQNTYQDKFPFLDNVQSVTDPEIEKALTEKLIGIINDKIDQDKTMLFPPEIVEEIAVYSFDKNKSRELIDSPSYSEFLGYLSKNNKLIDSIEDLKKKYRLFGWNDESDSKPATSWSSYKALSTEIENESTRYYLFNGEWLYFANNFMATVERDYNQIPIYEMDLPAFDERVINVKQKEREYNKLIGEEIDGAINFDGVHHQLPGNSKMEICDVLRQSANELIFVKRGNGIASIGSLCRQAKQSMDYLLLDQNRNQLISDIKFKHMQGFLENFEPNKVTVVLVVIHENHVEGQKALDLTFLGKMLVRSLFQTLSRSRITLKVQGVLESS